tara:strand:+ start:351 stop:1382 length:1032 start_codon:yes stop_codon:yes gene_type:complete
MKFCFTSIKLLFTIRTFFLYSDEISAATYECNEDSLSKRMTFNSLPLIKSGITKAKQPNVLQMCIQGTRFPPIKKMKKPPCKRDHVYVYYGPGTSYECVSNTMYSLRSCLDAKYTLNTIQPDEVKEGLWTQNAVLFILPGGADLPYIEHLKPTGDAYLRKYVESGGKFLGFCAGAYYAGNFTEFAMGTDIEVSGSRALSFFPGTVKGPCLKKYDYQSNSGTIAASISVSSKLKPYNLKVFYNGGGYFVGADALKDKGVEVIARYLMSPVKNKAAIIKRQIGKGCAILSSVHPEYSCMLLDQKDLHLKNVFHQIKEHEKQRVYLMKSLFKDLGLTVLPEYLNSV